jgi:hypothetical protein
MNKKNGFDLWRPGEPLIHIVKKWKMFYLETSPDVILRTHDLHKHPFVASLSGLLLLSTGLFLVSFVTHESFHLLDIPLTLHNPFIHMSSTQPTPFSNWIISTLKMEVVCSFDMLVGNYQTTQQYNQECNSINLHW